MRPSYGPTPADRDGGHGRPSGVALGPRRGAARGQLADRLASCPAYNLGLE
jgi:hypothetical protein